MTSSSASGDVVCADSPATLPRMLRAISVCILDPLNASSLWSAGDPEAIAAGFGVAAEATKARAQAMVGVYGKLEGIVRATDLEIRVSPVLGRIAIAVRQTTQDQHPAVAIEFCSILASQCVEILLGQPVPDLLFRGAVAYGLGDMADGRIQGPVFAEALDCAGRTAGAILWLAPSAAAVYSAGSLASTVLGDHDVPLVGGERISSKAVRFRLDPAAATAFADRAERLPGLDGALARAHSLRHLAWLSARR